MRPFLSGKRGRYRVEDVFGTGTGIAGGLGTEVALGCDMG